MSLKMKGPTKYDKTSQNEMTLDISILDDSSATRAPGNHHCNNTRKIKRFHLD